MCDRCYTIGHNSQDAPEIEGALFGISFYDLPYEDAKGIVKDNPQFRIFLEDDGLWHYTGCSASVTWLPDLYEVIRRALQGRS